MTSPDYANIDLKNNVWVKNISFAIFSWREPVDLGKVPVDLEKWRSLLTVNFHVYSIS